MTSTTHPNSRFYNAEIDIPEQDFPAAEPETFTVHTVHPTTGDLWASNVYGEQIYIPADEIPCGIRIVTD